MTDGGSEREYVPVSVLQALVDGWMTKVSKHDFLGSTEEYQAYMNAYESCADDIETVIEHTSEEKQDD